MPRDLDDDDDGEVEGTFADTMKAEIAAADAGAEVAIDPSEPDPSEPAPESAKPAERPAADSFADALRETAAESHAASQYQDAWSTVKNMMSEVGKPYGLHREQVMGRLLTAHQAFERDPASALETMAKEWSGAPPDYKLKLMNGLASSLGIQGISPEHATALNIEARAQQVAHQAYANLVQQAEVQRHQEATVRAANAIKDFASTHPDLPAFREDMANLMAAGVATGLEDSYAKAKMLRAPQPTAVDLRRQAVEKAKRASTPRTASYGKAIESEPTYGSFREELAAEARARGVRT